MSGQAKTMNPYPGLRTFQQDEDYLFFGREEQTLELLERLRGNRFVAVVGTSGSGKSSLVRCGLLSELLGGKMLQAGSTWEVAVTHPGGNPVALLAEALLDADLYDREEEYARENVLATLSRSHFGLVEAVKQANLGAGTNFVLVVDQFEEIFRFHEAGQTQQEAANEFVSMLLEAASQKDVPIYIVLTMRSDFIGECGQFEGLAETVNRGEFLIPRMNREQYKRVIEGPAKVAGGRIAPRLLQRLLNDLGQQADQLPCLQHALMRTWDVWSARGDSDALDLDDYQRVGKMSQALSLHADEVYDSLADDQQRELCRRLFQALTIKESENRGIRRPQRLGQLCRILDVDTAQLQPIIDAYRRRGVTFLMPPSDVELTSQTIIDISHESLMRVWRRLSGWVEAESQSAQIYRRLAETSELHRQGKAGVYHDPDLQIALSWRATTKPNPAWARWYHEGFDEAMAFLDLSQEKQRAEERQREAARQRELAQAKELAEQQRLRAEERQRTATWLKGLVAVTCLVAAAAVGASLIAEQQRRKAQAATIEAQDLAIEAQNLTEIAENEKNEAERLRGEAVEQKEELRHVMYKSQISDVEQLNSTLAQARLESCDEDLRGWEWDRLLHLTQSSTGRVLFKTNLTFPRFDLIEGSRQIVIGGEDGTLEVRDMSADGEFSILRSTNVGSQVLHVQCNFDASYVLLVRRTGEASVSLESWDLADLKLNRVYEHPKGFFGIAMSPTANRFVLNSATSGFFMFDLGRSQPVASGNSSFSPAGGLSPAGSRGSTAVAFHPSGETFLVCDGQKYLVYAADPTDGFETPLVESPGISAGFAEYSTDGETVLIDVFGIADAAQIWRPDGTSPPEPIQSAAFIDLQPEFIRQFDDCQIYIDRNSVHVVQSSDGRPLRYFAFGDALDASFGFDRRSVIVARRDGSFVDRVLNTKLHEKGWSLKLHEEALRQVAIHPTQPECVSCSVDGTVRVWNYRTGDPIQTLLAGPAVSRAVGRGGVPTVTYDATGAHIVTGDATGAVRFWNRETWECDQLLGDTNASIYWLKFSPSCRLLAAGSQAQELLLWDAANAKLLDKKVLTPDGRRGGGVEGIAFSRDERFLVATSPNRSPISVWGIQNDRLEPDGELVHEMIGRKRSLEFSPDGRYLAAGNGQGTFLFDWGQRDQKAKLLTSTGEATKSLRFTNLGAPRLITSNTTGKLEIWDIERAKRLAVFDQGESTVWGLGVAPESRFVLVALASGELQVLPTQSSQPEEIERVAQNILIFEAITRAWESLGVKAVSIDDVVDLLSKDEELDDTSRELAIQYVRTVVKPSLNGRLLELRDISWDPARTQEEYRDAFATVQMMLEQEPGYPTALLSLALLQLRIDDSSAALETLEQATQAMQAWNLADAAVLRAIGALVYAHTGKVSESRRELGLAQNHQDAAEVAPLLKQVKRKLAEIDGIASE